jgi:predicted MFS family arabinose efflux permease
VLIVGFGLSKVLWRSEVLLFLIGAGLLVTLATFSSLVQLVVPDALRGRVMSIYMMAFRGGMPLGSLVAGYFASHLGPSLVLASNGVALALVAVLFFVRSRDLRQLAAAAA